MTLTDHDITEAMITYGGGFVRKLGELYRQADSDNKRRLKEVFPEYWRQYTEMAERITHRREKGI